MKGKRKKKRKGKARRIIGAIFKLLLAAFILCSAAAAGYVLYIASESEPIDPEAL